MTNKDKNNFIKRVLTAHAINYKKELTMAEFNTIREAVNMDIFTNTEETIKNIKHGRYTHE